MVVLASIVLVGVVATLVVIKPAGVEPLRLTLVVVALYGVPLAPVKTTDVLDVVGMLNCEVGVELLVLPLTVVGMVLLI